MCASAPNLPTALHGKRSRTAGPQMATALPGQPPWCGQRTARPHLCAQRGATASPAQGSEPHVVAAKPRSAPTKPRSAPAAVRVEAEPGGRRCSKQRKAAGGTPWSGSGRGSTHPCFMEPEQTLDNIRAEDQLEIRPFPAGFAVMHTHVFAGSPSLLSSQKQNGGKQNLQGAIIQDSGEKNLLGSEHPWNY